MNPERFADVEEAFHRLCALQGQARRDAFAQLEAEDADLAAEVASLLDADDATWRLGDFAGAERDTRRSSPLQGPTAPAEPAPPPERIGGFRILEELGRGGMGVVYLGERDDDDFRQKAAIKVVKRGMDTDEILDRMRHERRILASLEHPNIARLIDGGTTEDGRPYFAMEHIEGRNLLEWVRRERLDLAARIRLFLEICAAVEYAHRNLVIHRDLKPSNILVTEDGTAKLLDFGIAKLLVSDGDLRTTTGELLLTPDYASPEQILGEPLTTASDVYSLGVVLYELLAGVHPYREKIQGLAGLYHFASKVTVQRASTRVLDVDPADASYPPQGSRPLARALAGDLDNILGMALRREPERRYPTVAELAEDLRRHLDFRPVRAHPETLGYRVSRFIRRQRLAVAAAGLIFLSLSGGIAGTSWQAHRASQALQQAEEQRQEAQEQAELARTVNAFLVEIFGEGDPGKHLGDEPTARDLLQNGRTRLDTLESQPRVLAALAVVMGQVYQELGDQAEARDLYGRALEIRQSELPAPHPDRVESLYLLADAERELGNAANSEALLTQALQELGQLPEDQETRAILMNDMGATQHAADNPDSAADWLEQALEIRQRLLGSRHSDTAQTLNNLAVVRARQGDFGAAADLFRQALETTEDLLGREHPESMVRRSNLAATLHQLGDNGAAVAEYRKLVETQRQVFKRAHPETGQSLNNLGFILLRSGQTGAALAAFGEAELELSESLGPDHYNTLSVLLGIALGHTQSDQPEDAFVTFKEFFQRAERIKEQPLRLLQSAHARRGRLWLSLGDHRKAIADFCSCLRFREAAGLPADNRGEAEIRDLLREALAANPPGESTDAEGACSARLLTRGAAQ
ncbi:MAG: serine/threonine-protein kinase [Acidobacteriota bacterium]